jgi:hypothetical protein
MVAAITLPGEVATMPAQIVHEQIKAELDRHVDAGVDPASRERLALLVSGMIEAESACPARIAAAVHKLGLSQAKTASVERQIRRIENDPELQASLCVHPFARAHLRWGKPKRLMLILDPTSQDERVVMLTAAVWYRGRALPVAWAAWPANTRLSGPGFWERVGALLADVAGLLPVGVPVTWLADRAFGTPAFTDQVAAYGWHWLVRVQGQTRFADQTGRQWRVRDLVSHPGRRAKRRGRVFKKAGWRDASVVAFWGRKHKAPLLLVSDLPPGWDLVAFYRQRYPIEIVFPQMTKPEVLAGRAGWDDITDFDFFIGYNHPIDEQFDQLPLLLEGRVGQTSLHALTERLNRGGQARQFGLAIHMAVELLFLGCQRLGFLFQVTAPPLVFG